MLNYQRVHHYFFILFQPEMVMMMRMVMVMVMMMSILQNHLFHWDETTNHNYHRPLTEKFILPTHQFERTSQMEFYLPVEDTSSNIMNP